MTRAALYDTIGDPGVLYVGEILDPPPGRGEVAVRVQAAGLNPMDTMTRRGLVPSDAPFPRRVGLDVAGSVEAVGEGAVYWDGTAAVIGDEVLGRAVGAVSSRVIVPVSGLTRRPDGLSIEQAAGLNIAGLTALSCLATVPLDDTDVVLIGGAAGAVGFLTAQLAAQRGARVIGSASAADADLLHGIGIEHVLYGADLATRVAAIGEPTAVIDCHGRDALDTGVVLGVPVDRMVAIADYQAVDELGVHAVERDARTASNLAQLADALAAGRLTLPIAGTFGLDEVADAFRALEGRHAPGKIVVVP